MRRHFLSLLAAGGLVAAAPAHALSTASAALTGFKITLADLDPGDGIAPTVVLDPAAHSVALAGSVSPGASQFWQDAGDGPFGAASISGSFYGEGGAASVSGDPFGAGATFKSTGFSVPYWSGGTGETLIQNDLGNTTLTLSPHTGLTFSGQAALDWAASVDDAGAYAQASLAFMQWVDGSLVTLDAADVQGEHDFGTPLSGTVHEALSISYDNTTDAPVTLVYSIGTVASASEEQLPLPAVDEPPGAPLALAGVLPLLVALRRRRGRAARSGA